MSMRSDARSKRAPAPSRGASYCHRRGAASGAAAERPSRGIWVKIGEGRRVAGAAVHAGAGWLPRG